VVNSLVLSISREERQQIQNASIGIFQIANRLSAIEDYWQLDTGYWLLATGYWLLHYVIFSLKTHGKSL
jgi:hypothetical protein